jgi:hypothetical protein
MLARQTLYLLRHSTSKNIFFLGVFAHWNWALNSGPYACLAGALPLESCPQANFTVFLKDAGKVGLPSSFERWLCFQKHSFSQMIFRINLLGSIF